MVLNKFWSERTLENSKKERLERKENCSMS